ncbi:MAG: hypothetical protein JJU46_04290 [Balneolaceae bacterium]|nr:hypothetical protein [Balneolaceae bacterium]MCH8548984.1 hypothetical protein [Balneolaceae bacterium]
MTEKRRNTKTLLKAVTILAIFSLAILHNRADAQQMIVDDAAVTTELSFQVEAWYGTEESWFQPGIAVTPWLEFASGLIFDSSNGFEAANWLLEFKAVPGDLEAEGYAYGLVAAPVFNFDGEIEEFFSYIPVSMMLPDQASVLHINLGIEGTNNEFVEVANGSAGSEWEWAFTTGIRGDFALSERVAILSEIFTANFETPSFQGGFRFSIVPDLVEMDVTYGQGFRSGMDYPGLNVGIAITPDSLW